MAVPNKKKPGFDNMPKPGQVWDREARLAVIDKLVDVFAKLFAVH